MGKTVRYHSSGCKDNDSATLASLRRKGGGGKQASIGHFIHSFLALHIVRFYCQTQMLMYPFAKERQAVETQGLLENPPLDELL